MTVKINAKALGIKAPIDVKESTKNIKKTLKLQLAIQGLMATPKAKIKLPGDAEPTKEEKEAQETAEAKHNIENQIELFDLQIGFISDILRLDAKHKSALDDLEADPLNDLLQQIVAKILHIEDSVDDPDAKK